MIIAQIIVVVFTSFPNVAYSVYTISTRTVNRNSWCLALNSLINTICFLIGFSTHASMFYVYLIASRNFYENVQNIFHVVYNRYVIRLVYRLHTEM